MFVDSISDDAFRSDKEIEHILAYFGNAHKASLDIDKDGNFEKVLYGTPRNCEKRVRRLLLSQRRGVPQVRERRRR